MNCSFPKAIVSKSKRKVESDRLFHLIHSARSPNLAMHRWGLILAVLMAPLSSAVAQDKQTFSMPDSVLLFGTYAELRVVTPDRVLSLNPPLDVGYNDGYFIYPGLSPRGDLVAWGFAMEWPNERPTNRARYVLGVYCIKDQKWKTYGDFDDIGRPSFSPDGSKIAFVTFDGREEHLRFFDAATEKITVSNVINGGTSEKGVIPPKAGIGWSPDGKRLVVEFDRGKGPSFVAVVDPSTGDVKPIAEGGDPAWSPAGEWIAYHGDRDKKCILVHPDGTGARVAKRLGAGFFLPKEFLPGLVWSPDGKKLLLNVMTGDWRYLNIDVLLLDVETGRSTTKSKKSLAAFGWVSHRDRQ